MNTIQSTIYMFVVVGSRASMFTGAFTQEQDYIW